MSRTEPYVDFETKLMICPFCDKREMLLLPAPVSSVATALITFAKQHEDCQKINNREAIEEN